MPDYNHSRISKITAIMKPGKITLVVLLASSVAACGVFKKNRKPAPPLVAAVPPAKETVPPPVPAKSRDGIFAPGTEELTAIQQRYKEVTLKTITEGYAIYTGACTDCHRAKSIYAIPKENWHAIVDDMAPGAKLTAAQKDAVYKYIIAIKATQPG
jgi:hypothetical protein